MQTYLSALRLRGQLRQRLARMCPSCDLSAKVGVLSTRITHAARTVSHLRFPSPSSLYYDISFPTERQRLPLQHAQFEFLTCPRNPKHTCTVQLNTTPSSPCLACGMNLRSFFSHVSATTSFLLCPCNCISSNPPGKARGNATHRSTTNASTTPSTFKPT